MKIQTIILAAGAGTRMKSNLPKVLHELAGKSMLQHVVDAIPTDFNQQVVVVVGHKKEVVKEAFVDSRLHFADQDLQLGTGHAVKCASPYIKADHHQLILYGDTPMITESTLSRFIDCHLSSGRLLSVLTAKLDNPHGYGRIIRQGSSDIVEIVEEKDCTEAQRHITEINTGMMLIEGRFLLSALEKLKNNNSQKEYYLTDIIGIAHHEGVTGQAVLVDDSTEVMGINDRVQLHEAGQMMNRKKLVRLMQSGVTIIDQNTTFIEGSVEIGPDTIIEPFTQIKGNTVIGCNCHIGPGTRLNNSHIGNGVTIKDSTVVSSQIDDDSTIGPYAYLRPGSAIGKHVKIGDFVEVKNARISDHSKVSHLSYIGDGTVGERVNIGCGVVFVNYDGSKKHQTTIEDDAFIGCNANLVAPITVGKGAYVAAGSTLTEDVPPSGLAIARQRQTNKLNWAKGSK